MYMSTTGKYHHHEGDPFAVLFTSMWYTHDTDTAYIHVSMNMALAHKSHVSNKTLVLVLKIIGTVN